MNKHREKAAEKRVLLVDDERILRELIGHFLRETGCEVVEANNGAEALGLFAQGRFDLVMTDYQMPFVKGNELAARIRRLSPRQPILMLTGYGQSVGPDNPVDAVLQKPLDLPRLRTVLDQFLNQTGETLPAPVLAQIAKSN